MGQLMISTINPVRLLTETESVGSSYPYPPAKSASMNTSVVKVSENLVG
jgi:hypothetical protein